jgi:secondary thiamine-phosphate synthase enzyme
MIQQIEIILPVFKKGFHLITQIIEKNLPQMPETGLLHIFLKHTSAGIMINENTDPSVRWDFENILGKLFPENENIYSHSAEGKDDMPAHLKSAFTGQQLSIPITNHKLNLGIWQGIYLCEYRYNASPRKLILTIIS